MFRTLFLRVRIFWKIFRDPRTPRWAKVLFAMLALIYGISPIDLVPDFIPFAGWIDDLIVMPLLLSLIARFAPKKVREEKRREAEAETDAAK